MDPIQFNLNNMEYDYHRPSLMREESMSRMDKDLFHYLVDSNSQETGYRIMNRAILPLFLQFYTGEREQV